MPEWKLANNMGLRPWLYARLGFCSMGPWTHLRRGAMPGDIVALGKDGEELARHRHQFCDSHLSETVSAMAAVPHEGRAVVQTEKEIRWSSLGSGGDVGERV